MAILVTRAALEALRGPDVLQELLEEAGPVAAHQEARLAAALEAGDNLIRQFLYLPEDLTQTDPRWAVFHELAVQEAFYWLHANTTTGATASQHAAATERRSDLGHMRKREQWPGTAVGHGNGPGKVRAGVVASGSRFSVSNMTGFV